MQSNDTWSVNAVAQAQAKALADGHYITVTATISTRGHLGDGERTAVTVDETPPTIAIGTIEADNIINKADAVAGVIIRGTVSDSPIDSSEIVGQTVLVTMNGKTYAGTVQPNDTWSRSTLDAKAMPWHSGMAFSP